MDNISKINPTVNGALKMVSVSVVDNITNQTGGNVTYLSNTRSPFQLLIAMLFIGFIGILGNCVTLVVLYRRRNWTSVTFVLGTMVVSDICAILSIFSVPIQKVVLLEINPLTFYFQDFFVISSSISAAIMGCERSFAVRKPLVFREIWTTTLTIKLYSASIVILLSLITVRAVIEFENRNNFKSFIFLIYFGINRGIPFIIITVANVLMIKGLKFNFKHVTGMETHEREEERLKTESAITKTVVAITVTYFFCMIPSRILLGLKFSREITDENDTVYNVAAIAEIFNFSVNFILYSATSEQFRKECVKVFCCCFSMDSSESFDSTNAS